MPLFMPDDELALLSSDAASAVAEKADEYIRKLYGELDTCSLLEQKSKRQELLEQKDARISELLDVEKNYNESSSSLNWHKERLRELETKITSLQEELTSCKDAAATSEEQYNAEIFTANKLVELYKESSEEWSRKAGELEGVIQALETRLSQVENDYKDRLQKEVSTNQKLEKAQHSQLQVSLS